MAMLLTRLHKFIVTPKAKSSRSQLIFWFSLSLTFSAIYSYMGLRKAFSSEYVVQDDARQHVFWMARFLDPQLFPNDLIADYFQSVAPTGYTSVYKLAAIVGIDPLLFNKLLPPVLGLAIAGYCFCLCLEIFPLPAAGFIATLTFNQNMGFKDDVISGTPRAFAYPLLLAFLYYLLRGKLFPTLGTIALLGLFYPQLTLLCAVLLILRLFTWKNWQLRLSKHKSDYIFCLAGLTVAFFVLLPFALSTFEFGPTITVAEAKLLPEFWPKGRSKFFDENIWDFFLFGGRSGMLPKTLFTPVTLCAGLFLPLILVKRDRFPLTSQLTSSIQLLPQLIVASIALFCTAHLLLFKLHLPSRYTGHSFRVVIAIATAISFILILDFILNWVQGKLLFTQLVASIAVAIIIISLLGYSSFVKNFPKTSYKLGKFPELYHFLQQQPHNTLVASVAEEVNNLPSFSRRSILVGREYAIPYHLGYYYQFRQRMLDLVRAQYSPELTEVKEFIEKYNITLILLESGALTPNYLIKERWIRELQTAKEALDNMKKGKVPILTSFLESCQAFETQGLIVIQADCIVEISKRQPS